MDKLVYINDEIGEFFNSHFISVKVQIDTTKDDDYNIRSWYPDAKVLMEKYKISGVPSYLFFSPEGEIVHRETGAKSVKELLQIANDALCINRQYYYFLSNYRNGIKYYPLLPYVARIARSISEKAFSDSLARDYIENYLNQKNEDSWINRDDLEFLGSFVNVLKSSDNVFHFFLQHNWKIDSIVGDKQYSNRILKYVITKEEITPRLKLLATSDKNWKKLERIIEKKYGKQLAESSILESKLKWYSDKKDWPNIIKFNIEKVDKYGIENTSLGRAVLNNMIYEVIFKHSSEKKSLNWAIQRMKIILKADSTDGINMDTYANLLYKSGKINLGLRWEKRAVQLDPLNEDLQTNLKKMQNRAPTWN